MTIYISCYLNQWKFQHSISKSFRQVYTRQIYNRLLRHQSGNVIILNMKEFFIITSLNQVLAQAATFPRVLHEEVELRHALGRILSVDLGSDIDIPDFARSTMDGFAVQAASTFGATESNPAYLTVKGNVAMGQKPDFPIGPGEAAGIATGGMLPAGSDSVVMIEYVEQLDDTTIEIYQSLAPGRHIIEKGEDIITGKPILLKGTKIRPQELGLLAAAGHQTVKVYKRPVIGIISTGDEIVPVEQFPGDGEIRDVNSYSLAGQVLEAGGEPLPFGIIKDSFADLQQKSLKALESSDMVMISGGSSVGTRDFTIDVLADLPQTRILVHGISISPGKPTILANSGGKPFWGLPGHVVSAMIVFNSVVKPFIEHLGGLARPAKAFYFKARLNRNIASAQGRTDFVRVCLNQKDGELIAEPILGKSGLIHTMVQADGLIAIPENSEGLDKSSLVDVMLL